LVIYFGVASCLSLTACASNAMTLAQQQETLSVHNQLRKKHAAPPLQWSNQLAHYAANYASRCEFKHSHGQYGENLAAGYPTATAAIKKWYSEIKDYSYQHARFSSNTGHFTQVVWKASTQLGCAIVTCNGKNGTPGNYLVCEYNPPGNVINEHYFENNVLKAV
jgi:uncharacterized protein YkwD